MHGIQDIGPGSRCSIDCPRMHPNATTLFLAAVLLGSLNPTLRGQDAVEKPPGSSQTDAEASSDDQSSESNAPQQQRGTDSESEKPKVKLTPESRYTVANTGLKGTQDRSNRPNPMFSPTVAQINLTKGNWNDWPWKASGITGDWLGLREKLQDNGVFIDGLYSI